MKKRISLLMVVFLLMSVVQCFASNVNDGKWHKAYSQNAKFDPSQGQEVSYTGTGIKIVGYAGVTNFTIDLYNQGYTESITIGVTAQQKVEVFHVKYSPSDVPSDDAIYYANKRPWDQEAQEKAKFGGINETLLTKQLSVKSSQDRPNYGPDSKTPYVTVLHQDGYLNIYFGENAGTNNNYPALSVPCQGVKNNVLVQSFDMFPNIEWNCIFRIL